jgi:spore germination protein YaaH
MTEDGKRLINNLRERTKAFYEEQQKLLAILEVSAFGAQRGDMDDMLETYVILDNLLDMCKSVTTPCNSNQPPLADKIVEKMNASDTDAIIKYGYKFTPAPKTYVSVSKDNKPLILRWLKNHDIGKELVAEDFNANAFTSFIVKLTEEHGYSKTSLDPKKLIPPEISVYQQSKLSMRKSSK